MLTIEFLWFDSSWWLEIFSLSHTCDKAKNIFLYIENMLLISVLTTWIEVCSDYYVVEIDPINPCLRWEGVMSRQCQSWSYVLGLACCVGAFYCNHVLNICDLQCMHIFEHNIFFYRKRLLRQTESFWQVGNLFLLFFYKLILWLFYTCK